MALVFHPPPAFRSVFFMLKSPRRAFSNQIVQMNLFNTILKKKKNLSHPPPTIYNKHVIYLCID